MSLITPNFPTPGLVTAIGPVERSEFSPVSLFETGFRHAKLGGGIFAVILFLTILITCLTTRQYESEMNILVQNARGSSVITPERTSGLTTVSGVTEEQVNSEMEVLRSKEIAEAALDPQWVTRNHTPAESKARDQAVEHFRKSLSVDLIRKSNVIHVAFVAKSPEEAQQMLKRLLSAFLAKQQEIERPAGASEFFTAQADRYKEQLQAAQREFAAYQQQAGVVSLPEKEADLDKQVAALEADLRTINLELADTTNRKAANEAQLHMIPERQGTVERTVPYQMSVEQLNTLLTQLENKREELRTKYLPTDRLVVENEHQIANTQASLAKMNGTHSQENSTDINPLWQQVSIAVYAAKTGVAGLEAKRDRLNHQIEEAKDQLSKVEGDTVKFSDLRRKVTELENDQQLYSQKRDEAQISDAMGEHKLLNVAVAEVPTANYLPIRPKPVINIALGILTALFMACGAIFFAEMSRDTVSNARELEAVSRYPVLATVPLAGAVSTHDAMTPYPPGDSSSLTRKAPWAKENSLQEIR